MIVILSPAKTMNCNLREVGVKPTNPVFNEEARLLANQLSKLPVSELSNLLSVNAKLADLNYTRFQNWESLDDSPAITAYSGEVYRGLDVQSFSKSHFKQSQKVLRILSGMYGIVKPLDSVKPYRLEMGLKWSFGEYKNIYQFWGDKIRNSLEKDFLKNRKPCLVNLASMEYFKAIQPKKIEVPVYNVSFKEIDNHKVRSITVYEKKARGSMAQFIIKMAIVNPLHLQSFSEDGYIFDRDLSHGRNFVFTRTYRGKV